MAKKGVKMNLADFNGPQQTDLPSAPTGGASGGGYAARGPPRGAGGYGDRDGGRDAGRPRGEEEEEGPSRADEADKWRRKDAPVSDRRPEEMPGRSDNEDKWRPRGGASQDDRRGGGFGGPSSDRYGGGGRDAGRGFGDRDGGRGFGDRDGGRGFGDRDGGERRPFGGDRDGGDRRGGFGDRDGGRPSYGGDRFGGESSSGDSRPAHLKNLLKKGAGGETEAAGEAAPAPAASGRFAKPPQEASEDREEAPREERRGGFGDRDQGERRPYGGDRESGSRFGGDRDGGDRPSYGGDRERRPFGGDRESGGGRFGDRDGGERRPYGGDRDGGERRPYGGDRESGSGGRFGDRDGGAAPRYGGYGGAAREGGGAPRYGGYGGQRAGTDFGALPTGPASRQDDDAPRSALRKPLGLAGKAGAEKADHLAAKPMAKEERKVEVDESLKKGVVSLAQKQSPLEQAVEDNQTITADQLSESVARLKLDRAAEYGNVLAKSMIDGKVSLKDLVAKTPALVLETLVALKNKKSDKFVLELVKAAQAADAQLDVAALIGGERKGAELDSFLESRGLLILKPVPDLTAGIAADLAAGAKADAVLATINASVDPKLAPGLGVTNAVAAHVFSQVYATAGKADLSVLPAWSSLLSRVATDADSQLRVLFEAQAAWFKAGAAKAVLKELFVALHAAKLVNALVFDAWRNDMVEKSKNGKSKALLQVHAWITDVQPKLRPSELDEGDADEELANEFGDNDD